MSIKTYHHVGQHNELEFYLDDNDNLSLLADQINTVESFYDFSWKHNGLFVSPSYLLILNCHLQYI